MKKNISQEFVDGMCKGLDAWVDAANKVKIHSSLSFSGHRHASAANTTHATSSEFSLWPSCILRERGHKGKT